MTIITRPARILLDFIGNTEAPQGFDTIFGNNQDKLKKPLTAMTFDQVVKAQPGWTKAFGSSACGRYQFMRDTLDAPKTMRDLKGELGLKGDELFSAALQDMLGFHLLARRGYDLYISGSITRTEFGKRLAQEWASFPVLEDCQGAHRRLKRGQSYYAGDGLNKALVSPAAVERVLDKVMAEARGPRDIEPAPEKPQKPRPSVPLPGQPEPAPTDIDKLGKPVAKTKTFWSWIVAAAGTPLAAFGGFDWRVQLAIVAIVVALALYAIKRRADIGKAVRELRNEISDPS